MEDSGTTREIHEKREPRELKITMPRVPGTGWLGKIVATVVGVVVLVVVLSAVHLLPQLRNPFAQTTTVTSQPVILKSITALSRYEAASGSFEVVVDLSKRTSLLPSFLAGSETLFIGQGNDIAYIDFSGLNSQAITMSANGQTVTASLAKAQPEQPAAGLPGRPEQDPDRSPAEPPAGRSAEEHPGNARRHADLAGLPARNGHVRQRALQLAGPASRAS